MQNAARLLQRVALNCKPHDARACCQPSSVGACAPRSGPAEHCPRPCSSRMRCGTCTFARMLMRIDVCVSLRARALVHMGSPRCFVSLCTGLLNDIRRALCLAETPQGHMSGVPRCRKGMDNGLDPALLLCVSVCIAVSALLILSPRTNRQTHR